MTIRLALLALVAAILAAAPVAAAKEIQRAQVCGASACFTFDRANSGDKLALFDGSVGVTSPPARPSPWYRLRITIGGEDVERFTFTDAYVPSADRIRRRPRSRTA
jgi:hypothetical protein